LFAEKLPRSPLEEYFPDYQGGNNYDAACDYLLHRFVSLNQSAATKQIYAHYTCATDTQQIKCESLIVLFYFLSLFCRLFLPRELCNPVKDKHTAYDPSCSHVHAHGGLSFDVDKLTLGRVWTLGGDVLFSFSFFAK